MSSLELALIGNCGWAGLIDDRARIVWACLPRFDSDPVFSSLLQDGEPEAGFFQVELVNHARSTQSYQENTAIVVTQLHDVAGNAVEVRDFAPRFEKSGRTYRPTMVIRQVLPLSGEPRVRVRLRPTHDYGAHRPRITHGSNHIRYPLPDLTLRLTTDVPVAYVLEETAFVLERPVTLILGPDESLDQAVPSMAREHYERTHQYWTEWVRTLSIPFEWQAAVIRAAITLKLCAFEESGALVAAVTSSIPEAPGSQRNWDYRYCWLRDAYFVVHALNRLGATRTMEGFLDFITNVVAGADGGALQPVYRITLDPRLVERDEPQLSGYRGMGPVRVGNQAYEHVQNDVYGSVILAATQTFFDQRLLHQGGLRLFERLEGVGEQCAKRYDQPDAGLWEYRTRERIHTFSSVMCWAGCDRLAKIAARLGLPERTAYWRGHADHIRAYVLEHAWDSDRNTLTDALNDPGEVDASLLLLHELGFIEPRDPRFLGTLQAVEKSLRRGSFLFRYAAPDDFGTPETAFNICTFWYIETLHAVGRVDEARELFENMLRCRNGVGLLSEDLDPRTHELWGNFPQTYSMVGLINAAMRLSESWESAF